MFKKHLLRANIYFVIAAIGLITAWWLNGIASLEAGSFAAGLALYADAWFGTPVDWVLSVDLLVVAIAVVIFMIIEARRLGMKRVWLYFLVSGFTAIAFTFPLFMAFRERALRRRRLAGGRIESFEFDGHRVDVWRPATKSQELEPNTPVVVLHDGKNIFDEALSHNGTTWGVLDSIRAGEVRGQLPLIIAVWGFSDATRLRELAPEMILSKHPEFWNNVPDDYKTTGTEPMGDAYVSLISDAILPFVAERYGLRLSAERTAVGGASMGGLMSLYLIAQRPELFGSAICFSTHWWFGGATMVDELVAALPAVGSHRVWTDRGNIELDSVYQGLHEQAVEALRARGYGSGPGAYGQLRPGMTGAELEAIKATGLDLMHAVYPNTGHHERYWRRRLPDALNWWLKS
jgi:predicted alpha/beta superfamily hydrolase